MKPDRLAGPTPCADWDLRTLVNHVILWTAHSAERRARDEPLPEELMSRDFAAGPGFAEAYAAQLDRAVGAWSAPTAWEGELKVMGSPTPAADVGAMLLMEIVLHGWDVARAIGEDYRVPADVAAAVYRTVEGSASCSGSTRVSPGRSRCRAQRRSWTAHSHSPAAIRRGRRAADGQPALRPAAAARRLRAWESGRGASTADFGGS